MSWQACGAFVRANQRDLCVLMAGVVPTIAVFFNGSSTIAKIEEYIKPLKTDLATVKMDLATVKTDLATVKTDLATVKADVHKLKTDVHKLKLDGEIIDTKLNIMNDNILAGIIATGQAFAGDRRGLAQLAAKMQPCRESGGTGC
ncbi:hypothetical protein EV426DRAFT_610079 [Tirmania nivea]|nr:hypothetical protein EV426DRAFT_610079 [Tirmania nivea]